MSRSININNCGKAFDYPESFIVNKDSFAYASYLKELANENSNYNYVNPIKKPKILEIKEPKISFKIKLQNKLKIIKAKIIDLFSKTPKKEMCPIDLKMTRNYITTNCGHYMGTKKFLEFMKNKGKNCPLCRTEITSWKSSKRIGVSSDLILKDTKKILVFKKKFIGSEETKEYFKFLPFPNEI